MNRWSLVVLVAWLMSCGGGGGAMTCDEGCPSGSRCDALTNLCVRDDGARDAGSAGGVAASGGGSTGSSSGGGSAGGAAGGDGGDGGGSAGGLAGGLAGGAAGGEGGGSAGGTAGGFSGGAAGGAIAGGSAGGASGGSAAGGAAGGSAGGAAVPPPVFTLTTPGAGAAVSGQQFELRGGFTEAAGREVTSASVDMGDGVPRPLTLENGAWRVTVSLPQSVEDRRTVTLTARDASAQTTIATFQVAVDTLGPRATLTTPATGTVVGAMTRLEGTVVDPATPIMTVTVDVGSGPQMAAVAANGAWHVDVSFPPNLDRVQRSVTIAAVDALGNQSSQMAHVLVDTQGPTLALVSPSSGTVVGAQATLSGTAADGTGPVSALTVDVGAGPLPVTVQPNGTWSLAVTFPPNLDRVSRTVTLRGQDALGNVSQTTVQLLVDTQGPVLAFTSPATNERLGVPRTQSLTGTVSDASGVTSVTMDCADGTGSRNATVTGTSWSVSWPLPTADHVSFVCTATATDSLGNARVVSRSYFVDTVAPVITIQSPAASAPLGGPSHSSVSVTAGLADGSNLFGTGSATLSSSTVTGMIAGTTLTATVPLPTVDYQALTLSVTATDAEGNSATATRSVTVDRVAPVLTITSPTQGQTFNIAAFAASDTVTMTWTIADGDAAARTTAVSGISSPAGSMRSLVITTSPTADDVPYGATVTASDSVGNTTTVTRTFQVDRVPPTVVGFTPGHNTRMNVGTAGVSVQFSEPVFPTAPGLPILYDGSFLLQPLSWDAMTRTYRGNGGDGLVRTFTIDPATRDRAGNLIVNVPTWTAHFAPGRPPSGTLLRSDVTDFDAASDLDGEVLLALRDSSGNVTGWTVGAGAVPSLNLSYNGFDAQHAQASRTLNGIRPERRWAINGKNSSGQFSNANDGNGSVPGAHVAAPALAAEDGWGPVGQIVGSSYFRAGITGQSIGLQPQKIISSDAQWVGITTLNQWVQVSRRECGLNVGGTTHCGFTEGFFADHAGPGALASVSGAVSSSGCLVVSYDAVSGRRAAAFPKRSFITSFQTGVSYATVATPGPGFSVAPRTAGGLWAGWLNNGVVQLASTTNTTLCTNASLASNWTMVGTVSIPAGAKFRVVQAGTGVAVIYLDGNAVSIVYP